MSWNWSDTIWRKFIPRKNRFYINGELVDGSFDTFKIGNSIKLYYPDNTNYVELQEKNFVLNDVIGKIAKTFSNAKFGNEKSDNSKLLNKIENPNKEQSKEEFLKEFAIYLLSSGFTMIWKKYESFGNFDTMELININPDPKVTEVLNKSVKTEYNGLKWDINKLDIIFFYDVRRNEKDKRGHSRIKPLYSQVKNIEDAQRAKNIQITNSGTTIVSPKASPPNVHDEGLNTPITKPIDGAMPTQRDDMEDKLNGRGIENRIIVASKGVDSTNLGANLASLDFYKMVESDILAIFDAFGFPPELSPYGKNATFENKPTAESMLIENEILPLASSLTKSLNAEFANRGTLTVTYDHLSSVAKTKNTVHETNAKIAQTYRELATAGIITATEAKTKLTEMGVL